MNLKIIDTKKHLTGNEVSDYLLSFTRSMINKKDEDELKKLHKYLDQDNFDNESRFSVMRTDRNTFYILKEPSSSEKDILKVLLY